MESSNPKRQTVRVTAFQMPVAYLDPDANRRTMVDFVNSEGRQGGVDLIVFPELANSGYVKGRDKAFGKRYWECAETIPGPTTDALAAAARAHGVHVVVGLNERHPVIPGTFFNSAVLIGPDGAIIGVHHKVNIPGQEKHFFVPGGTLDVYRTSLGSIGMLVCYDLVHPEACRVLALKGAEIVCAVFNAPFFPGTMPKHSLEQLAFVRAWENKLFVVTCNRIGTENEVSFFGRSAIAAPSCEILALGKEDEESVLRAELHMDRIIEERAFSPVFRDRRPDMCAKIVEPLA